MRFLSKIFSTNRSSGRLLVARLKHTLPDLPYDYNALEPYISAEIMQLHHAKHHQAYVDNLNIFEEKVGEAHARGDVGDCIKNLMGLKFHGGGHINHSIFWQNLSPNGGEPDGELLKAIIRDFGSMENFKSNMDSTSTFIQGVGWGWLGYNKTTDKLQVVACANQDPLEATTGLIPLLGFDVWEHAFYLQYKTRPDYLDNLWKVVNWKDVADRYANAQTR